jgi:Ca-activated chloride channel homolog
VQVMIHIDWPWIFLCLPLPWLVARLLPPAASQSGALFLPFAASVLPGPVPSFRQPRMRAVLFGLVWLALVVAAARPQWLDDPLPVPTTGRRLLLAVDISGSMVTEDMAGNYSRLDVVKQVAGDFIRHRHGDQVGLILFGSQPYLQAPLTEDLDTVGHFLRESMVGMAGQQTAIGDAIGLGIKRLQSEQEGSGKQGKMVMILLTDGGNNAGLMDPLAAARMAASAGLRIYTIGVGSAAQENIFGAGGNTDLDEGTLKSIARITGGEYFRATDADALQQVYARIDKLEPGAGREQWYRPHSEWFQWPLAVALLLSIPAALIRGRT